MHYVAPSIWIILGPVLLIGALSLLLLLGRTGRRPPDDHWRGVFYSNPEDPAILVPKRYGIGYTLNFGNPWSWIVLAVMLLMVALPIVLSVVSVNNLAKPR
jgi:uncharacterized membrane protein